MADGRPIMAHPVGVVERVRPGQGRCQFGWVPPQGAGLDRALKRVGVGRGPGTQRNHLCAALQKFAGHMAAKKGLGSGHSHCLHVNPPSIVYGQYGALGRRQSGRLALSRVGLSVVRCWIPGSWPVLHRHAHGCRNMAGLRLAGRHRVGWGGHRHRWSSNTGAGMSPLARAHGLKRCRCCSEWSGPLQSSRRSPPGRM